MNAPVCLHRVPPTAGVVGTNLVSLPMRGLTGSPIASGRMDCEEERPTGAAATQGLSPF